MVRHILALSILMAGGLRAVEYIHLDNATDLPVARPGHKDAVEHYAPGVDPNENPFGPSFASRFVPVVYPEPPFRDKIVKNLVRPQTSGLDGRVYWGKLNAGRWEKGYQALPKTLVQAKRAKAEQLEEDSTEALSAGYAAGQYTFPFSEEFFNRLAGRIVFLELAIASGSVPEGASITFSDIHDREVSADLAQLRSTFADYGVAYLTILEKVVANRDEIRAAGDLAQVGGVKWTF